MNRHGLKLMRAEQQALRGRYDSSENKYERQILSEVFAIMRDHETNYRLAEMAADGLKAEMVEYCYDMEHPDEDGLERVVRAADQYKALKENLERTETALRDVKSMLAYADIRA